MAGSSTAALQVSGRRRRGKHGDPMWPFPLPRLVWVTPQMLDNGDFAAVHVIAYPTALDEYLWLMQPVASTPSEDQVGSFRPGVVQVEPDGWRIGEYLVQRSFAAYRGLVALVV